MSGVLRSQALALLRWRDHLILDHRLSAQASVAVGGVSRDIQALLHQLVGDTEYLSCGYKGIARWISESGYRLNAGAGRYQVRLPSTSAHLSLDLDQPVWICRIFLMTIAGSIAIAIWSAANIDQR